MPDTVGTILYFMFKVKPTVAVSKTKHYLVQVRDAYSNLETRINQFAPMDGKTVWEAAAKGTVKEKMDDRLKQLQKILPKLLARYPPKKK